MNSEEKARWIKSIFISLLVFIVFSFYLFIRRGYYNIYIVNKVFGSSAVAVAGLTLLIGPLRSHPFFMKMMSYRRQLGLMAFLLAGTHVVTSLIQQKRFPFPAWYFEEWLPITFGAIAIVVWLYMTYISRNSKIEELGAEVWKKRLSIAGHVGFLAIFLHLVMMKYQGWMRWINGQVKASPELANPAYPPASIFVFIIMLGIIIFRIINVFFKVKTQEKVEKNKIK